jgi:hypothetical protein
MMEVAISNGFGIKHLRILNTSVNKKKRQQKFLKAPFSFGDETYEDITIREGPFLISWLFQG